LETAEAGVSGFNARAARAKRPCPIWFDAFLRDTQHLDAQGIGAYVLILGAMWARESCDLPDNDRQLATIARVSHRQWKAETGPMMRSFLTASDGALYSKRLRQEAEYVERQLQAQSDRRASDAPKMSPSPSPTSPPKNGPIISDKPLKSHEGDQSADTTAEYPRTPPRHPPSQLPNLREEREESVLQQQLSTTPRATGLLQPPLPDDATDRETILSAMGHDPSGLTPTGRLVGNPADMEEARRWRDDLGLSLAECVAVIRAVAARPAYRPPVRFSYFAAVMSELAAAKAAPVRVAAGGRGSVVPFAPIPEFDFEDFMARHPELKR
jgi:uncharacterized protein YdaU (DUF1376 family)